MRWGIYATYNIRISLYSLRTSVPLRERERDPSHRGLHHRGNRSMDVNSKRRNELVSDCSLGHDDGWKFLGMLTVIAEGNMGPIGKWLMRLLAAGLQCFSMLLKCVKRIKQRLFGPYLTVIVRHISKAWWRGVKVGSNISNIRFVRESDIHRFWTS